VAAGHAPVTFTLKVRPEYAAVIDGLAKKRGLNRSEYLRALVQEDALRLVEVEREKADRG
jgi:ribbon-helix-helix CopG family protein